MERYSYKSYTLSGLRQIPQAERLTEEQLFDIEVVGNVLPFKTNNYVCDHLINWDNVPDDPIFILTFPQRGMLEPEHYDRMAEALRAGRSREEIRQIAHEIRLQLNPHPAGQATHNVPELDGVRLTGIQHKYDQTVLFFPGNGQTCHAYCTFCFRWPQFVGMNEWKFAMRETELLVEYLRRNPQVTDVLFTGGDPLIMKAANLAAYIDALLEAGLPSLQTIRIGTKALGYWPYKFTTDPDAEELLELFRRVTARGINLAIMAHFNHPVELDTDEVKKAIGLIRQTGAQIRTQSPVMRHINDDPAVWAEMWRKQVNLNCIPYYMFLARDTGAQHYFSVPLVKAWEIFQQAYQQVSGVCRTVRGPSMSCTPGKVQVLGVSEVNINGEARRVMSLRFLQGRNPDWVARPFFAEYDEQATWIDDLKPAFGAEKFFFEEELEAQYHEHLADGEAGQFE
jgi:KamA family protein